MRGGRRRTARSAWRMMKWMVRADWRPPKTSSSKGSAGVHARRHGEAGQRPSAAAARGPRRDRRASAARCSACLLAFGELAAAAWSPISTRPICWSSLPARREVARRWPLTRLCGQVDEPVDDKQPGEEEMPAASVDQIAVARQRDPGRESRWPRSHHRAQRQAEQTGRLEYADPPIVVTPTRSSPCLIGRIASPDRRNSTSVPR